MNADGTYILTTTSQIRYNFDASGRLTSIVDRNSNTTTVSYDANGNLLSIADPGGRALNFTVDGNGRIAQVSDPLGRSAHFSYTSGDLTGVTDVRGGHWTYTYFAGDLLLTATNPLNNYAFSTSYDGASRAIAQSDGVNNPTCIYYGSPPPFTSFYCPGVTPAPAAGQAVVVDPRGNKATYSYDASFNTTQIVDPAGGVTSFAYDGNNNVTCKTDPYTYKTGLSYDANGNVTQIIDALNTDANCNLAAGGVKTTISYTTLNDPAVVTDRSGGRRPTPSMLPETSSWSTVKIRAASCSSEPATRAAAPG
jgi:YD repeat-containing protein